MESSVPEMAECVKQQPQRKQQAETESVDLEARFGMTIPLSNRGSSNGDCEDRGQQQKQEQKQVFQLGNRLDTRSDATIEWL